MGKVTKSDDEWRSELDSHTYEITRKAGTERAFTGKYWDTKTPGTYQCSCCGASLFDSNTKYDSGSGWPSFYEPVSRDAVATREDNSLMMQRVEVLCAECDAHLGHVFRDGPEPTGLRFCMNSASLDLKERDDEGS
jgi:peptide-methionine (R)-S-oxide reductase